MIKLSGKAINQGIAIGKIKLIEKKSYSIEYKRVGDPEREAYRYEKARTQAKNQLWNLYEKALESTGKESAAIFEMQEVMLEDLDYVGSVIGMIQNENAAAEYAVFAAGEKFAAVFSSMDDEYMKARADDIRDITERLLLCLQENGAEGTAWEKEFIVEEPVILLAEDLSPSETAGLNRENILGFVTKRGSMNSHTAILARMMDIPALVVPELSLRPEWDGKTAVINGGSGELIVEPDEAMIAVIKNARRQEEAEQEELCAYKGKESVTPEGKRINIYANIGSVSDLREVAENDADGIGLFRSEFLFLERSDWPTEEEQFQAYRQAAETMAGKKVIIRTLDIGADKKVSYFNFENEENPAMGYRAIRISLTCREIFKTQLRALYRASSYGCVSVMYPMIISVLEVKAVKEINEEVKAELRKEGIPFEEMEQGIMIETPAAVMISDELAKEVDFFSIGTNDLTQYTLAIDRQNESLEDFYDPHHPAVLKMIQMVAENGHRHDCWVGICGELGADTALTKAFIDMGIDELSVSPKYVLPIRKLLRNM